MGAQKSIEKPRWRATALALATAVLLGVSAFDASALALGPVMVKSALGEPLRAEIEIPEINPEELASLRTAVAKPDAFRAAGLDYNPALAGIQITLERRSNGRPFLRLSSQRAVNDPFLDLILETTWSSGRIVRDYTMLFDPPNLRRNAAPLTAQVSPVTPAPRVSPAPAKPAAPVARAPAPSPAAAAAPAAAARAPSSAATPAAGADKQVTVQSGDTAGKIAAAQKPPNVSLDQMLLALLRANPEAFIDGNVNRLKAGAVLDMPTAEQTQLVPPGEAHQTVIAQSRDFNEYRRRLAEGMPASRIAPAERQASGKLQAQVEDKKPGAAAPDKLTLSKGAVQSKGVEDKIARERAAQDSATRLAELNKNIADLNKLGTSTAAAPSGSASAAKPGIAVPVAAASAGKPVAAPAALATASAATTPPTPAMAPAAEAAAAAPAASAVPAAPGITASAAVPVAAAASDAASAVAPMAASASAAQAGASSAVTAAQPVASAAKARPAPAPAEFSVLDDLMENPIVPATLGGVLALLLGFAFYRARQRRKSSQVDSSFLESRLQPDSFFGASGGQRIDTNEGGATGSSMVYSPSQLDAAGDVDPVAEADVYLAYGRDLQAEEILKEAMRTTPQRVAIHSKLLEIYSKRRDVKAFEQVANEAYALTQGEGPEWEHICELGQELDSSNVLYRPGGQPVASPARAASLGPALITQPVPLDTPPASELDLDLDFSLDDEKPAAPAPAASAPAPHLHEVPPAEPEPMPSLDMDFTAIAPEVPPTQAAGPSPVAQAPDLDMPDLVLDDHSAGASAAPAADPGMIEFDLGALSLDLDSASQPPAAAAKPATAAPAAPVHAAAPPVQQHYLDDITSTAGAPLSTGGFDTTNDGDDPLATKLALAEEFNAIGDPDGARSLAQEVLAEASGDLKSRAQRLLAEIS